MFLVKKLLGLEQVWILFYPVAVSWLCFATFSKIIKNVNMKQTNYGIILPLNFTNRFNKVVAIGEQSYLNPTEKAYNSKYEMYWGNWTLVSVNRHAIEWHISCFTYGSIQKVRSICGMFTHQHIFDKSTWREGR